MLHQTTLNDSRRSQRSHRPLRRGFTLIEIIVVVTIIAILAGIIIPRVWVRVGQAKTNVAKAEVVELAKQMQLYLLDNGMSKPPSDLDLSVLSGGNSPYIKASDLIDPWGREYILVVPGEFNPDFDVMSYGADGQPGGEGEDADIVNK